MAINIEKTKLSSNLTNIISGAVDSVKKVRSTEQARKEAEFQRAIANGMSYEDQVVFRQKQLEEENSSSFSDIEYIAKLEKSVSDSKKLARFNKYRTRYAETLTKLSSGKINEEQYLETLKSTLNGIDDPDLRLEIQNDIVDAEKGLKQYRETILTNQVKKAQFDGTQSSLNDAISRITSSRTNAVLNNNDDEVSAYDETLSALRAQLSTVRVQDSVTDFQVTNATRGVNPTDKLNFLNGQVQASDSGTPIKIGDKSYISAQQFWTLERDSYLAGTSQNFGNFFSELDKTANDSIKSSSAKFGYPTQSVLDSTLQTFNSLRARPEVAPFIEKLDATQSLVMSDAVDKLATMINNVGTNNLTFKEADIQLQNINKKYGIDVTGYRLQLDEKLRNLARGGVIETPEATALAPDVTVELPNVEKPTAEVKPTVTTPTTPEATVTPQATREVALGETLTGIATNSGVSLEKIIELNPQYKENPDLIKVGDKINLPGVAPVTPVVPTTPTVPSVKPTPTIIPTNVPSTPPTTPSAPVVDTRVVKGGDSLTAISKETGVSLERIIELNPQYKENPNLIKPGESIKLK